MAKDTNSQNQRVTIHQPPQRFFCETIIRIHLVYVYLSSYASFLLNRNRPENPRPRAISSRSALGRYLIRAFYFRNSKTRVGGVILCKQTLNVM